MTLLQATTAVIDADLARFKESLKCIDIDEAYDETGSCLIHLSVHESQLAMISLLLEQGASVNRQRKDGVTALWLAVCCEEVEISQLLIAHKADVNVANNVGLTALHLAVKQAHFKLFKILIAAGADPYKVAGNGHSVVDLCQLKQLNHFIEIL